MYFVWQNKLQQPTLFKLSFRTCLSFFLAHLAKDNVSFCHHLASVVCRPLTFHILIFFRNQPIRNKNCLWRPCLLMDRDEMSYLYRGPSIDASYQVSVHLADGFQRRLKCEKLTDDIRRTPSDGKSSHCLIH
jgi:hypothetical protein